MYAIIESCGKQYKVSEGDVVFFEKLDAEEGKKVTFDKVVLVSDEGKVQVGNPYVKSMKVEGKVVSHGKGKKIIVFKMKVLFIGDIVGNVGRQMIEDYLYRIRKDYQIDFVIANVENATHGKGLNRKDKI